MTPGASTSCGLSPDFRQAMRQLAATVAIITTRHQGQRHGMAATAVTSVTIDPPTLLVCINRSASIHSPLLASGIFGVNLLGLAHEPLVSSFSGTLSGERRFDQGAWSAGWSDIPVLRDAQAVLMCRVARTAIVGSHEVVFGEVMHVGLPGGSRPLIYQDGKFLRVTETAPAA